MTLEEMMNSKDSLFLEVPKGNNKNIDNVNYTDNQLYLAGLIYTDGSLKDKNKPKRGYTFYQSDLDLMISLDEFGLDSVISGPHKNCYSRYIKHSFLDKAHDLIYKGNLKDINVIELS